MLENMADWKLPAAIVMIGITPMLYVPRSSRQQASQTLRRSVANAIKIVTKIGKMAFMENDWVVGTSPKNNYIVLIATHRTP